MDAFAGPPPRRIRVADTPEGLRVEIPGRWGRRHAAVIAGAVFAVFVCVQVFGVAAILMVAFWGVWAWLAREAVLAAVATEVVLVDGAALTRWRAVGGRALGRRRFDFNRVRNVRATYVPIVLGEASYRAWRGLGPPVPEPCVAFDYGAEDVLFGIGLTEAETEYVVAAIEQRFPGATGRRQGC